MKLLLLALLLWSLPVTAAQQPQPQPLVARQYDRFEDRTRYFAEPILILSGLELTVLFTFRGKGEGNEIEGFWLSFVSQYPDWRFSKNARLYCRVDGQSLDLGNPAAKDAQIDPGSDLYRVQEFLVFPTKYQTLQKIVRASDIEFRLGDIEFRLHANDRKKIRALLARVKAVKK